MAKTAPLWRASLAPVPALLQNILPNAKTCSMLWQNDSSDHAMKHSRIASGTLLYDCSLIHFPNKMHRYTDSLVLSMPQDIFSVTNDITAFTGPWNVKNCSL